jgi:hypothetical protein
VPKLSKQERAELEARLAEDDAEDDDDFEVEIGSEGNYARVPYRKGKSWLQKTFGIDLDAEPKQEAKPKDDSGDQDAAKPARFAGRRVS